MKILTFVIAMGALSLLAGCQTIPYQGQARHVTVKPQKEGVVSIPVQARDEDRAKAEAVMSKNCQPLQAQVLEEGEVAVGTKTDSTARDTTRASNERKVGSLFGIPLVTGDAGGKDTSGSATVTSLKEWHISYKCDSKKKSTIQ